jgi:hypothetical protein
MLLREYTICCQQNIKHYKALMDADLKESLLMTFPEFSLVSENTVK